jgi:uncharacterized protein YlxW (UPF0749 family)
LKKGGQILKKGKITMEITIGLMCVILTSVIFVQFKTIGQTDINSLENMREDELRAEISSLKIKSDELLKKVEETNSKIAEYEDVINLGQEGSNALDKELKQSNDLVGKNDVSGEGVVVILTDTENVRIQALDLLYLLNELKIAGSEAISINDQRIIYNSYVVNIGDTYISVDGEKIVSPYVVKAIGNPTYLESGLSKKQYGYIDTRISEGKSVILERQSNIIINKFNKNINFEYIQEES